jgi:cytochrome bd-type quinol oxidase subunit 2
MILFWAAILAISTLLYVLLDGFDLGVGILTAAVRSDARREAMMSAIEPIGDGNETWLVTTGVVLWGAFPVVYANNYLIDTDHGAIVDVEANIHDRCRAVFERLAL